MEKICFATNNANKLAEISKQLEGKFEIVSLKEIGCTEEIPETTGTIEGNARQKANYVWENYKVSCFADDTGLCVEALNGEPGVDSAHYAGPQRSSEDNINLLLQHLEGKQNRKAHFLTIICLTLEGKEHIFEGKAEGTILTEKVGTDGFGYDPVFQPNGYEITFAQMGMEEKNQISHRGKAVKKLMAYLDKSE